MEVVVDGRSGGESPAAEALLKDVLQALRGDVASRHRSVVSVTVDGEVLDDALEEELGGRATGSFSLLEVRTVDPIAFSKETLAGLTGHATNLERSHEEAAALAKEGAHSRALSIFEECFRGWGVMTRAVRDIGTVSGADFTTLEVGGGTVDDQIRMLHDILVRFKGAFEIRDAVGVAEIARQELIPQVAQWRAILEALSRHVGTPSGSPE